MNDSEQRMTFGQLVDRTLWTLVSVSVGFAALQISRISDSMIELNVKMAVVIQEVQFHERRITNLEQLSCQPQPQPQSKGSK